MEMNDIMALKAMSKDHEMTPYEQFKIGHMQSKRASGTAIGGLAVGIAAAVAAVGVGFYANSKANAARDIAAAQNAGTAALLASMAGSLAAERQERIAGDVNLTNTVTDTQSGSQQSALTAQQAAELSAVNSVMQQTYSDFVTGRASLNPTPVSLYSAPQPCACPGCGCNG